MNKRVWEIYQTPQGKFHINKLTDGRCEYRGNDVTVGPTTTGQFDTRQEAERALLRLLKPEKYATYYDEWGNDAE